MNTSPRPRGCCAGPAILEADLQVRIDKSDGPDPTLAADAEVRMNVVRQIAESGLGAVQPMDLSALGEHEPEPPAMIIDDWMPAGYATLLAGHGGIGKSAIALNLAACIALGRPWCGLPAEQRHVLYLSCEDRERVLHWRLRCLCDFLGITLADLAGALDIFDLVGHNTVLWDRNPFTGATTTAAYDWLREQIETTGAEVLVVDGVADTFAGNENARTEVKRYINALVSLIPPETGAVILVAHVAKPTASGMTTSEGYSGSTGWHNSSRARWYLYPETERTDEGSEPTGRLRLELQKSNLGRADQAMIWRWDDERHLFTGHAEARTGEFERRHEEQQERDGILEAIAEVVASGDYVPAAAQGPRTAHHVLAATKALPETLKTRSARKRFWRHMEHLRRIGKIRESTHRRGNRHATAVIELIPVPDMPCAGAPNNGQENTTHSDASATCADASHSHGGIRGLAHPPTAEDYQQNKDGK